MHCMQQQHTYLHFIHMYKRTYTHYRTVSDIEHREQHWFGCWFCCCHWLRYISECRLSFRVLPHHIFNSHRIWFSNPTNRTHNAFKYSSITRPPLDVHVHAYCIHVHKHIRYYRYISISNANTIEFIFSVVKCWFTHSTIVKNIMHTDTWHNTILCWEYN